MNREELMALARVHDINCFSIYLPTSRAGEEVDQKHAQLRLKNVLKELEQTIDNRVAGEEVKRSLRKLDELKEDDLFFRHQSDGLAIFIHSGEIQTYTLPVRFEQQLHIADHFYLIPLLPYFNDNGRFYLMALSLQQVSLYECTQHSIAEVVLEEVAPRSLEDVVGKDYENKSLQYRTSGASSGGKAEVMYHGQGSGKDDRHKETKKFLRAVDQAVTTLLGEDQAPLVLACVDQYLPAYRDITKYQHLFPEHIPGNPDEADPLTLHEKGWLLVEEHFTRKRREKREQTRQWSATGKATYDLGEILPAALDGRIDTLFLQKGKDHRGLFDLEQRVIRKAPERTHEVSLFNMAATHTLLNGGDVFLETAGHMPFKESKINALFRYKSK
jgi:hypothetical protein